MIRRLLKRSETAPASLPAGQRIYAIGDVHGRLDLYLDLLERLRADNAGRATAEVTLILLGDLIDRGPDSAAVVAKAMQPLGWARTILLKGNHEAAMLDALDGDREMLPIWLNNGGRAALRSWGVPETVIRQGTIAELIDAAREAIPSDQRTWLERGRQCMRIGDYFFVHAGVRPGVDLNRQALNDSLWIRDSFLTSRRDHGAIVVHGHSVTAEVDELHNRIGIDTGAYATGRLTALGLEGAARWFVQTKGAAALPPTLRR